MTRANILYPEDIPLIRELFAEYCIRRQLADEYSIENIATKLEVPFTFVQSVISNNRVTPNHLHDQIMGMNAIRLERNRLMREVNAAAIGEKFEVCSSAIQPIGIGKTWAHIPWNLDTLRTIQQVYPKARNRYGESQHKKSARSGSVCC